MGLEDELIELKDKIKEVGDKLIEVDNKLIEVEGIKENESSTKSRPEKLSHFDQDGKAFMVDVTDKKVTSRQAVAKGRIRVNRDVYEAIIAGTVAKGDVLGVARVAGIMGVKRTADLIPMCHVLLITKCSVDFQLIEDTLEIETTCTVKVTGQTGVEMEALVGVNIALLTIYDMCKALDKKMVIDKVYVYEKTGGKSGIIRNEL